MLEKPTEAFERISKPRMPRFGLPVAILAAIFAIQGRVEIALAQSAPSRTAVKSKESVDQEKIESLERAFIDFAGQVLFRLEQFVKNYETRKKILAVFRLFFENRNAASKKFHYRFSPDEPIASFGGFFREIVLNNFFDASDPYRASVFFHEFVHALQDVALRKSLSEEEYRAYALYNEDQPQAYHYEMEVEAWILHIEAINVFTRGGLERRACKQIGGRLPEGDRAIRNVLIRAARVYYNRPEDFPDFIARQYRAHRASHRALYIAE